jgi:hypothetical protein
MQTCDKQKMALVGQGQEKQECDISTKKTQVQFFTKGSVSHGNITMKQC